MRLIKESVVMVVVGDFVHNAVADEQFVSTRRQN